MKNCRFLLVNALLMIAALLLAACAPAAEPPTPSPSAEFAALPPTIEPTRQVLPPPTAVPATATPQPALAVPESSPTPAPTPTPTETPIPETAVTNITLKPIVEGVFTRPLYVTHAGDERLFVVEQPGRIRIVVDGQLASQPFLDISERVGSTQLEQGLLGLAFHPQYAENGFFFVNYTDLAGNTQIARFSVSSTDPDQADPQSEVSLLSLQQPYPNHNGGQVAFGPDGYLYIGVGDGGSANDPLNSGQDPGTLLGTLLRLDVDDPSGAVRIPGDNPFVDMDGRRNEIWAWGLRNPWRFSFDRVTGNLFIADVGQNMWEEISLEPAASPGGVNYGWNIMEGTHCFSTAGCDTTGLQGPIFDYAHDLGCSVTGGYVYRGQQHLELYGNYFLGDFCQGTIWALFPNGDGTWASRVVLETDHVISSFGEDAQGELYLTDHTTGSLYQLLP